MEVVVSAAAGELVSRFFSFLMGKYSDICSEEDKRVERLEQLLLKAHMVVEEADRRYITNSGMLLQLKMLSRAMYHGYHAQDTFKCNQLIKDDFKEVMTTGSFASYLGTPLSASAQTGAHQVTKLVTAPTYLYVDNFMFGRQTEKQQVINFLLHHNPLGSPAVLPIIGGDLFKTLAFGSARAEDHPKLTLLAGEFIKLLEGSFVGAYSFANTLRRDLSLQFWLIMLNLLKKAKKKNLSMYGTDLYSCRQCYPIDLTDFLPSPAAQLLTMPPRTEAEVSQRKLPKIRIKDMLVNPSLSPTGDFDLVTWESRIPPYTEFCNYVPSCAQQQPKTNLRRKRDATTCR